MLYLLLGLFAYKNIYNYKILSSNFYSPSYFYNLLILLENLRKCNIFGNNIGLIIYNKIGEGRPGEDVGPG
jgi:hypothetical protein